MERDAYLDKLLKSVNETAHRCNVLVVGLLGTALFLAVMLLGTTDEALFRQGTIALPQLGTALPIPLISSYILAPVVFLFLHFGAAVQLVMLDQRLRGWNEELDRLPAEDERRRWRHLVNSSLLAQAFLLSGRPGRSRVVAAFAWFNFAVLPILMLVAVQISFLRYQSEEITVLHKTVVALDLVLLLWVAVRTGAPLPALRWRAALAVASQSFVFLVGAFVFLVSAFYLSVAGPDEEHVRPEDARRVLARCDGDRLREAIECLWREGSVHLLDAYPCHWWRGFGCRFLQLGDRNLAQLTDPPRLLDDLYEDAEARGRARLAHADRLRLSERNLRFIDLRRSVLHFAVLDGADLTRATMTDARLQRASLDRATLYRASLNRAELQGASFVRAILEDASLNRAQLQRAVLDQARMYGASLDQAQLQGARLGFARLHGASLFEAQLHDARLREADLTGADLRAAELQGASLLGAKLQGADLRAAGLQGADLRIAALQGAALDRARLQGAALDGARLQGASLGRTQLQGASFVGAELQGTVLTGPVDAADFSGADLRGAALTFEARRPATALGWIGVKGGIWPRHEAEEIALAVARAAAAFEIADERRAAARDRIGARAGKSDEIAPNEDIRRIESSDSDFLVRFAEARIALACGDPWIARGVLRAALDSDRPDTPNGSTELRRLALEALRRGEAGTAPPCPGFAEQPRSLRAAAIRDLTRSLATAPEE